MGKLHGFHARHMALPGRGVRPVPSELEIRARALRYRQAEARRRRTRAEGAPS